MIARLIIEKGVVEFLEAAKIVKGTLSNVTFQLLGKTDEEHTRGVKKSLIDQYEEEGVISYLGELEDVRGVIEMATCVVLPSYREGTPRTLLEAAAMGKPVVTTNVPGCKEVVVDNKTGLLCEVRDAKDLAEKIISICNLSTADISEMGKAARCLVEDKFDEKKVIEKYQYHTSVILNSNSCN
jgi:glycosyltransferase involved in cell wall biosynthesis